MKKRNIYIYIAIFISITIAVTACSSNNCPMNTEVLCSYYFYDSKGTAITYTDTFSVKTLLPGNKTAYTYRKLGYQTITLDSVSSTLIAQGYSQTAAIVRRDTTLVNQSTTRSYIEVPMGYFHNADTLIFDYKSITKNDTVIVEHESYAHVELPECGSHYYHKLKSIKATDAAIDHIEIVNPTVDYEGNKNIKIYFNGVAD